MKEDLAKRKLQNANGGEDGEEMYDDEKVTDQFLRDQFDVMSYYQTNMLCEAFTDVNKFYLSENEMLVEQKISQLYGNIEDLMEQEQCKIVDKMNESIIGKKTNFRA
jgi:hypothetical protein